MRHLQTGQGTFPFFQISLLASNSSWPMDPDVWDSATLQGHSAMLAPAVGSDGNENIAQPIWHYIGTRGEEEHSPLLIVLKTRGFLQVSP